MKKLNVLDIVRNGITIGLTNVVSLLGAIVLWILTIWIPYLNVGTTIAISSLPLEMAKGKMFSPTVIFDGKYRTMMGEYFLLSIFLFLGVLIGFAFLIIPGYVIAISWSLSLLIMIDKKVTPLQAITASNLATLGNKWMIFFANLLLVIPFYVLLIIFLFIPFIGIILNIALVLVLIAAALGIQAYIYKELAAENTEETVEIIIEETTITE
jgi:hypothetical protein